MARILPAIAGGILGAALPGVGFAVGWAVGSIAGNLLFPATGPDIRNEGPHISDPGIASAEAGVGIPIGFGSDRYTGQMIWCGKRPDGTRGIVEVTHTEVIEGGKGVPGVTNITYSGRGVWASAFAEGPASQIMKVWADSKCVYDATGTETEVLNLPIKWYMGTDDQLPDPTMEASEGVGNVPAYRGIVYAVFDWDLEQFGNHFPNMTAEIAFDADAAFPFVQVSGVNPGPIFKDPNRPYVYTMTSGNTLVAINTVTNELTESEPISGLLWSYGGPDANGFMYANRSVSGTQDRLLKIDPISGQIVATSDLYPDPDDPTQDVAHDGWKAMEHPVVGTMVAGVGFFQSLAIFSTKDAMGLITTLIPGPDGLESPVGGNPHHSAVVYDSSYRLWNCYGDSTHGILRKSTIGVEPYTAPITGETSFIPVLSGYVDYDLSAYFVDISEMMYYAADNSLIVSKVSDGGIFKIDIAKLEAGEDPVIATLAGRSILNRSEAQRGIGADGVFLATGAWWAKVRASDLAVISEYDGSDFDTSPNTTSTTVAIYDPASNSLFTRYTGLAGYFVKLFLDRFAGNGVSLASVVRAISARVGLLEPRIVVDNLEPYIVRGFSIKRPSPANAALRYLADGYFFDGVEEDFKVKFPLRGGASVRTIEADDLGAELGEQKSDGKPQPLLTEPRKQDKELPRTLSFQFVDPDRNYDQNSFPAKRKASIIASDNDPTISVPIVFSADEAKNLAWQHLFLQWVERNSKSGTLMPWHRDLSPADVVTINYHGKSFRLRLTQLTDDSVVKFQSVEDRVNIYVSADLIADGGDFNPPPITDSSNSATEFGLLDIPLVADYHQSIGGATGVYVYVGSFSTATGGTGSGSGSSGGTTVLEGEGEPVIGDTTTLSVETAHNISAYSDYNQSSANAEVQLNFTGNYVADGATIAKNDAVYDDSLNAATPANVSKLPIKGLLYTGATTRIGVHGQLWFVNPKAGSGHINVGYDSDDQTQVNAQLADMKSRGMDWSVWDWYGQGGKAWSSSKATHHNSVMLKIKTGCEATTGMDFAIGLDVGAISGATSSTRTDALISELNYCASTYYTSAKYLRYLGRPIVHFFGLEAYESEISWDVVRANVNGNPLFIFRNSGGIKSTYADGQSNGGYAWPSPSSDTASDPAGLSYLTNFYNTAKANPGQLIFGTAWLGFNGTLTNDVSWSKNKHIAQQNGLTWLQTVAKVNSYYSAANQLPFLMVSTWNDVEEGSAMEFGVEPNVTLTASVATDTLSWTPTGGNILTGHSYVVLYGTDGSNFTVLNNFAMSTTSLDLASALSAAPSGTYKLRVKRLGQPCIRNVMSNEVTWVKP